MAQYGKVVEKLKWASGKAMEKTRSVAGKTNDSDLQLYDQLTPDSFEAIKKAYGEDSLFRYIKYMESKKVRTNANS